MCYEMCSQVAKCECIVVLIVVVAHNAILLFIQI